jgi:phenylacetate-CoA ligase
VNPVRAVQLRKLRELCALIARENPFYAARLPGKAIGSLEEFTETVPFTTKREIIEDQERHPPYGSNLTYPLERYTRFAQTSATTGKPMRWLDTPESWDWMLGCWARVFDAAGVSARDRIYFAFSFGPFLGFWTAFECAARRGNLCIPGGGMRSAARLAGLIDLSATVLCCTPTYAIRLAATAEEEGIDLGASKVRTILVAGEPGGSMPGTRALMERLWRARVVDHHGMTEIGPVSYGCPKRADVLHVAESEYIAEVIDPENGRPAAPGTHGELVLTNLGRHGSPLLRYRTGDVVEAEMEGVCECGSRDLALRGGILGRTDDMVVVRGVNVYPAAIDSILRGVGGVAEYRVEVRTDRALADLHLDVEPAPDHAADPGLAHRIETALRNALALRVPVALVPAGSLPRFEMKAKRWIRV